MKSIKMLALSAAALSAYGLFASVANDAMTNDPQVVMKALSVNQRYPWNGKVDIDFSLDSTMPEAFSFVRFAA